jgi:hypothetical protein
MADDALQSSIKVAGFNPPAGTLCRFLTSGYRLGDSAEMANRRCWARTTMFLTMPAFGNNKPHATRTWPPAWHAVNVVSNSLLGR